MVSRSKEKNMKSTFVKVAITLLIVGVLSACGSQTTDTPASQPTEAVAPTTQAPTNPQPTSDTTAPTEATAVTQPPAESATLSFAKEVLPILESRCMNCHGGTCTEEG